MDTNTTPTRPARRRGPVAVIGLGLTYACCLAALVLEYIGELSRGWAVLAMALGAVAGVGLTLLAFVHAALLKDAPRAEVRSDGGRIPGYPRFHHEF